MPRCRDLHRCLNSKIRWGPNQLCCGLVVQHYLYHHHERWKATYPCADGSIPHFCLQPQQSCLWKACILLAQGRQSRVGSLPHADVCESACSNPVVCTICVILFHMWLGLYLARVFHLKTVCPKLEYSGTCALQVSSCFYMYMFYGGAGPRQAQMDCRLMESTFQTSPV